MEEAKYQSTHGTFEVTLLNIVTRLEQVNTIKISLRDCDLSDRIIVKCVVGLTNIKIVDLSGNNDITHVGWKCLADTMR